MSMPATACNLGRRRVKRSTVARTCGTAAAIVLLICGQASADAVTHWNQFILTLNSVPPAPGAATRRPPNAAIVDAAYMHIAMYDAVNAIEGGFTPFAIHVADVPAGASSEAAASAAAFVVLSHLYPALQPQIDAEYAAVLAPIPDGLSKSDGIALGQAVANAFLSMRAGDGLNDPTVTYTFQPVGPGVYEKTRGPAPTFVYAGPVTPWMATFRPFAIKSPDQFRAPPPPSLKSRRWADDFNEVKALGAHDGSARTPAQTDISLFWGPENAAFQVGGSLRDLSSRLQLTLADDARLFAQAFVTSADSLVGCFDSKYHYNFWRPETAIHEADIDGNDRTSPDPDWLPHVTTPGHPEYPSAHGCATGGLANAIAHFFHTKHVTVRMFSRTAPNRPVAEFDNTQDLIGEVINARVYNGVHYRNSVERGAALSHRVAAWVASHYFRRVDADDDDDDVERDR
jgi:PAP2 superfamily protein